MKKSLWIVILCFFSPSFAHGTIDRLETTEDVLFSNSNVRHTEYRRCLTTQRQNCARGNDDYEQIEAHDPSVADTLAWIGDQLINRKLVHFYQFEGCKVAIDMTDGSPASYTWLEEDGDKLLKSHRSVITPPRHENFEASWFGANGHYTYLRRSFRDNGSALSPKRLIYYNDAALIDLTKIRETKSHVITDEKGDLALRDDPASKFRFNFFKTDAEHIIGTQFGDEASIFTEGPSLFPNAGKTLNIFDELYVPFQTDEHYSIFVLMLTLDDVEFALNIAKAFRHAIELCELKNN